jgi:moderate conductance mechanosensitive channel
MSRDWIIDRTAIAVTYDADLDKAKKIVKQVGKELLTEPESRRTSSSRSRYRASNGLANMEELRQNMMPRRASSSCSGTMIKKAFDENGIRFASPTVQVAGVENTSPAAAHQALKLVKPPPPE